MAATRLIPLHVNKGKTVAQCLADRTDYSENEKKTNNGEFISSYECDPKSCDQEFLLSKREYQHIHGFEYKRNVIAYQIRQLLLHKAAKEFFNAQHFKKLPKMKELSDEYAQILAEKKKEYAEYKDAKSSMQDFLVARQNIEAILGTEEKTQEETKKREKQI